jgi:hypothetical protein
VASHTEVIAGFGQVFARPQWLDPRFHRYLIDAQDIRAMTDEEAYYWRQVHRRPRCRARRRPYACSWLTNDMSGCAIIVT